MKQTQPERVLPADVFDTLELTALAFDGVGRVADFDYYTGADPAPCCIHGMAYEAEPEGGAVEIRRALYAAGIDRSTNDQAVADINFRKGQNVNQRVDFLTEYVPHLNITRGE